MRDLFVEVDVEAIKRETLPPLPDRVFEWSQEHIDFFIERHGIDRFRNLMSRELRSRR